jgi:uncharacterized protein (TIGR02594 family)
LSTATGEDGQREEAGERKNNPRILEYLRSVGYLGTIETSKDSKVMMDTVDETAWCACFVNWCLLKSGQKGYKSAKAEHWLKYGRALDEPVPGPSRSSTRHPRLEKTCV